VKKKKTCAVRRCTGEVHGRGLCVNHYRKMERKQDLGEPLKSGRTKRGIFLRLSGERLKLLREQAKRLGFVSRNGKGSAYALGAAILESWDPNGASIPDSRESAESAGTSDTEGQA
jgi:hypothetical protein